MEMLLSFNHESLFFKGSGGVNRSTAEPFVARDPFEQPVVRSYEQVLFSSSPFHRHDTEPTIRSEDALEFPDNCRYLVFRKQFQRVLDKSDVGDVLSKRKRSSVPKTDLDLRICSLSNSPPANPTRHTRCSIKPDGVPLWTDSLGERD